MADMKVLQIQQWLVDRYNFDLEVDGYTGWKTVTALIKALQKELGFSANEIDGSFGPSTETRYSMLYPNGLSNSEPSWVTYILRCGMYCRGIDGGTLDEEKGQLYTSDIMNGVMKMKEQLGLVNYAADVKAIDLKAVFTTDAYTNVGDEKVREIQQRLNRDYLDILHYYIATNGLYERNTNTAIKKAIQSEIGVTVDGSWGSGTKNALPALTVGSTRTRLVYLLQYLLYLNGFDPNGFDGSFGNGAKTAVMNFQELMKLDVDGSVGPQTWFALVLSCGDTSRSANACDTRFEITPERAQVLKNNGYQVVGRYLTGGDFKQLREGELQVIFNAGLKAFIIYQDNNRLLSDFKYNNGKRAALEASTNAIQYKIPKDTVIYFAVDLDIYEDEIDTYIIPFFNAINLYLDSRYKVGIYGPRLVCQRISDAGLAVSSFVADMSTGYSCNIGQKMPANWCYDQFVEISNFNNDFDIDKVNYNGSIEALSSLASSETLRNTNSKIFDFLQEVYSLAKQYNGKNATIKQNNSLVLEYLTYVEYNSIVWDFLFQFDKAGIQYIEEHISKDCRYSGIYDSKTNSLIGLPHLAASIYWILNQKTGLGPIDANIADLLGWAGDLLSFAGEFQKALSENKYENCSEELILQLLGSENSLGFGLEDFMQDLDAWALYKSLDSISIDIVFKVYYDNPLVNKCDAFVSNRLAYGYLPSTSGSNYNKIYMLAKQYLETDWSSASNILVNVFRALVIKPFSDKTMIDNIAKAFASKVTL